MIRFFQASSPDERWKKAAEPFPKLFPQAFIALCVMNGAVRVVAPGVRNARSQKAAEGIIRCNMIHQMVNDEPARATLFHLILWQTDPGDYDAVRSTPRERHHRAEFHVGGFGVVNVSRLSIKDSDCGVLRNKSSAAT